VRKLRPWDAAPLKLTAACCLGPVSLVLDLVRVRQQVVRQCASLVALLQFIFCASVGNRTVRLSPLGLGRVELCGFNYLGVCYFILLHFQLCVLSVPGASRRNILPTNTNQCEYKVIRSQSSIKLIIKTNYNTNTVGT
jgi:hypothetical protein